MQKPFEAAREISVHDLREWLQSPAPPTLLDVRNEAEFAAAHLPGSVLVPLHELEERLDEIRELAQPMAVLCHHGVRSFAASEFLRSLGLRTTSVRGGLEAWSLEIDPSLPRY